MPWPTQIENVTTAASGMSIRDSRTPVSRSGWRFGYRLCCDCIEERERVRVRGPLPQIARMIPGELPRGVAASAAQPAARPCGFAGAPAVTVKILQGDCREVLRTLADASVQCVVLDPFGGAGTVGRVADRLGRDAILIKLNPEYVEMQRRRLTSERRHVRRDHDVTRNRPKDVYARAERWEGAPPDTFQREPWHQVVNLDTNAAAVWLWVAAEGLWLVRGGRMTPRQAGDSGWRWAGVAEPPYAVAVSDAIAALSAAWPVDNAAPVP